MNSSSNVAAIVLAAGSSSRLGTPKQLLDVGGETLLRRTTRLVCAECSPTFVVLGAHAEQIAPTLYGLPVYMAFNLEWGEGMASSLRAGVSVLPDSADAVLLTPCDLPRLSREHLRALFQAWENNAQLVASSWAGDKPERDGQTIGAPAVIARRFWPELLQLRGDVGARSVFRAHADVLQTVAFEGGRFDIDTPQDWRAQTRT